MARHFSKKDRNRTVRREKPMILIIAEGKNVTESGGIRNEFDRCNYSL